jgi:DNA-binding NarL/FixJ family response regulator
MQALRIRVLIVDDHKIVRAGLASLLNEQPDIEVIGQAGNGREAISMAGSLHPDVIIMDVSMPVMNGDEATRQIKTQMPGARIIALSMFEDDEIMQKMFQAGAEKYVLKTAPSDKLIAAIHGNENGNENGAVSPLLKKYKNGLPQKSDS